MMLVLKWIPKGVTFIWIRHLVQKQPPKVFCKLFLEISQNSQENICSGAFLVFSQVFSCEFCEISKNTFFTEHLWMNAYVSWDLVLIREDIVDTWVFFFSYSVGLFNVSSVVYISQNNRWFFVPSAQLCLDKGGCLNSPLNDYSRGYDETIIQQYRLK